ncbi:hypothetical protein BLNAU_3385 [Blattamonas nauphoetae]|uniref:Uncharacterized protein n=1 Tax=Blattamonas nauphoetae TaxID=2049346 RepID=A0ABQ9YCU3_9EUKA|nr:hypothetical protein BLNAU_3385 [Blattamonas nauphoetae]
MTSLDTTINSSTDSPCPDCHAFLYWNESRHLSDDEKVVVLRSLVATVKLQTTLDIHLEVKAVKFLKSVIPFDQSSADALLTSFASISDEFSTDFVQSIVVLISSPCQVITSASMKWLTYLLSGCSTETLLSFVKAALFPQLITALNPPSLSFVDSANILSDLVSTITFSFRLSYPHALTELTIKDHNEQQVVHETVLKQVLAPAEKYICHLCVNRCSIVDIDLAIGFMIHLARILRISPYYQPTVDFVLHLPVCLTIPSCLTLFDFDGAISNFLFDMKHTQRDWNNASGEVRQKWKTVLRMLRMEAIEDVIEEKLQNDDNSLEGNRIVARSIEWNNLRGMNLRK